jgi:uncharacterized protein YcfJ
MQLPWGYETEWMAPLDALEGIVDILSRSAMLWYLNRIAANASNPTTESMKNVILASVLAATLLPANAQLFSRESLGGAALGGLAGGIIGHNSGRRTAEGVAIGAGAGLLLGAITHSARRDYYYGAPTPYVAAPGYYYGPVRPNYAVTGTVLGGVAGGIIGHNSGRRAGAGIAIGAGTGLLLGALAEQNVRRTVHYIEPAPTYVVSPPQTVPEVAAAPPATPAPQVSVINNYPGSSSQMSSANGLFGR